MEDLYKKKYEALLVSITDLANNWDETEKETSQEIWGECAYDLITIVENEAEQM